MCEEQHKLVVIDWLYRTIGREFLKYIKTETNDPNQDGTQRKHDYKAICVDGVWYEKSLDGGSIDDFYNDLKSSFKKRFDAVKGFGTIIPETKEEALALLNAQNEYRDKNENNED